MGESSNGKLKDHKDDSGNFFLYWFFSIEKRPIFSNVVFLVLIVGLHKDIFWKKSGLKDNMVKRQK